MVWNVQVIRLAAQQGLDIVNGAWEDTGRPTEYEANHIQPDGWWGAFFSRNVELCRNNNG